MSSPEARERWRTKRTDEIEHFCSKNGFSLVPLNNGYQLRIENVIDVYPTNGRWCWLPTGERGGFHTTNDLRKVMLAHLPHGKRYADQKEFVADTKKFAPRTYQSDAADAFAYAMHNVETITEKQYNKWYRKLYRKLNEWPMLPEPNQNRMTPRLFWLLAIYCWLNGLFIGLAWAVITL